MKRFLIIIFCMLPYLSVLGGDWKWWNDRHGWESGMPSWRSFLHITPGYLGPNALPVPEMKKGYIVSGSNFELGLDLHFRSGDPTQNIFAKYYRSFSDDKIAVELYGVVVEHYAMSEAVRDERVARDFDGKGFGVGDFYFATLVQLSKDRKFPNTMLRLACKTASGGPLEAARYSDSPGYFLDLSFSKNYVSTSGATSIVPFASLGFFSWQTNDDMNLQNDALMYGAGAELKWGKWALTNSLSGYAGYKRERDCPIVYTLGLERKLNKNSFKVQFLSGLHDWTYQTVKFSYIIDMK